VPFVSITSGFEAPDGSEETLTEYLCDWPGCANRAVHWLGSVPGLGVAAAVCDEHRTPLPPDSPDAEEAPVRQPRFRRGRSDT
jgi:hypothetical protein